MNSLPSFGEHASAPAGASPTSKQRRRGGQRVDQQTGTKSSKLLDLGAIQQKDTEMKDIQDMLPIVTQVLLSVATRQRQTESILNKTYLISPGATSVVAIKARVLACPRVG
ncbi:unnamed protein product [Prorocentrum cordatum]|uniref:Uncharacterized protein n=1 Tax=Prorocentrum cordatum TaxID=2364126 RepID=A0ABN9PPH3_9DINO|nr:unnamed protein product [Polarella glacialis]